MNLSLKTIGLFTGPLAFLLILCFFHPEGLSEQGVAVLASTAWIAIWWITEALPLAATSLLPIVLIPLAGGGSLKETVSGYSHPFIFLFLGGFILAIAVEKWGLHKRIALNIIRKAGTDKKRIILGFMLATAFLSMWISNTATAVMMLPIGLAIISQLGDDTADEKAKKKFGIALMLGIGYSASIGGIATLIGTPPNLMLAGVIQQTYGVELSFLDWLKIGLPFAAVMLFIAWKYLTRYALSAETNAASAKTLNIKEQLTALGTMSREEKLVLIVFTLTAFAWVTRSFLLQPLLPALNDSIIAIAAALVLFTLPSSQPGKRLLSWEDVLRLPWGILLLFGGGISLAVAFDGSGLAEWIGAQLQALGGIPLFLLIVVLVTIVNFLTEITSNTATTAVILPILAPMALVVDTHPFVLMTAAAMAASCAFMLPVATPPNAIVFGSGYLEMKDMIRFGFWLNLISIALMVLVVYFLLPFAWGIELSGFPKF